MKKIKKYGEKILREKSEEVKIFDDTTKKIIKELKNTLSATSGIGLAAPQIGISKRIFIAIQPDTKKIITVVNPKIEKQEGDTIELEGCLSFPEIYFSIKRPEKVIVSGMNEYGKKIVIEGTGILARCFCHEIDHLNGVLIIDYATEEEKKIWKEKLEKIQK